MKLHLSPDLSLPLDAVTQTIAFLAKRGAGKSYGSQKLTEEMLRAGAQVVILDPVGNWYALRLGADGKSKGISIPVFGGLHGDLPLQPFAGALIADLVVDRELSAVLDVSMMRKGDRKKFATDFGEQLFHRKKEKRTAMHLVVEEAQVFVPQRVQPDEARMLGAYEDLVKLGRNFGIGVTLISQRPQAVNKDALSQTEVLVVLQTNGALERKAIKEWIVEQGLDVGDLVDTLPGLAKGEAWVWSPTWLRITKRIHIGKKTTFDGSATPEVGAKAVEARQLAPVELEQLRKDLAAVVDEAEKSDPKVLRKKIAELEAELRKKPAAAAPAPKRVEVPVLKPAEVARLEKAAHQVEGPIAKVGRAVGELLEILRKAQAFGSGVDAALKPFVPMSVGYAPRDEAAAAAAAVHRGDWARAPKAMLAKRAAIEALPPGASAELSAYGRHLLETIAGRRPMLLTRSQLSIFSGRSTRSSAFDTAIAEIKNAGLVEKRGDQFVLTPAGELEFGASPTATGPREVQKMWLDSLPAYEASLLRVLLNYPAEVGGLKRETLAELAGKSLTSSAFDTAISTLKKNGLVTSANGVVTPAEALFGGRAA